SQKEDRLLHEAGFRLRREPRAPKETLWIVIAVGRIQPGWAPFLGPGSPPPRGAGSRLRREPRPPKETLWIVIAVGRIEPGWAPFLGLEADAVPACPSPVPLSPPWPPSAAASPPGRCRCSPGPSGRCWR